MLHQVILDLYSSNTTFQSVIMEDKMFRSSHSYHVAFILVKTMSQDFSHDSS